MELEIIVVDTGSTDRTKEIAARYADKVLDFVWVNDFSAARNYSISQASYDYILSLDCDEIITQLDLDQLFALIEQHPEAVGFIAIDNHYFPIRQILFTGIASAVFSIAVSSISMLRSMNR